MSWLTKIRDRVSKATAGPWHRGKVLRTANTERLSNEQRAILAEQEKRCVFAYFSIQDEGRSRELICEARMESVRDGNVDFIANSREDTERLLKTVDAQKKVLISIRHMITVWNGPLYGILPSKFLDSLEKALKSTEES